MLSHRVPFLCAVSVLNCLVFGQSVVSVRSGVVHFFEGSVSLDGQPLEQRFGRFYDIKPGSELRTDNGRVEVLLTPGVFLRVDENSSIRMLSDRLTDTRVEFIGGAAALDSRNGAAGDPLTIIHKGYEVRVKKPGTYKFNSAPAELRVVDGEAEVAFGGKAVMIKTAQAVPFTAGLAARSFDADAEDGLDRWAKQRSEVIAAGNTLAAASDNLSSALDQPPPGISASGGGYDYGQYFPGDPPPDRTMLWSGYSNPLYMSPYYLGTFLRYNYMGVPPSRLSVRGNAYRQPSPLRTHPYVPAPVYRAPTRMSPSVGYRPSSLPAGIPRAPVSSGGATHAGAHR